MPYSQYLEAFIALGNLFNKFCESDTINNDEWLSKLETALEKASQQNSWFTRDHLIYALKQWGQLLTTEQLQQWQSHYQDVPVKQQKKVAIIMAGNIPLVGFHDFLCVLMAGHQVVVKLSSNDSVLLPFIKNYLVTIHPNIEKDIEFTEEKLGNFDGVIATGSTNTSRYFDYYFGKYPNIIRKNRNSVAVLSGNETTKELELLGEDIFRYFGLGCRSVYKVFVPTNYNFDEFFTAIFRWKHVLEHHKFVNNYDYNKAVYLMSELKILDNGFLILKEDEGFGSPIATLFFEYYSEVEELERKLVQEKENIQCVVSNGVIANSIAFGATQKPGLNDYADHVDTMEFLINL